MKILSHRGYWKESGERNSPVAFARSLELRFGLETDVRDCAGRLVVSHDMPSGGEVGFEHVASLFHDTDCTLAINIKADGLAARLKSALARYDVKSWFAFDMSIPDMRNYLDEELPVFARVSEVEREPAWIEEVAGIWFDSFHVDHYDVRRISEFLDVGKLICVVSPELHRWSHEPLWAAIKPLAARAGLMLCTDYPEEARQFFM
jgi:hypothetical protein